MPEQRLGAEWVREWCGRVDAALARWAASFREVHGHPPGGNSVRRATDESHRATGALVDLTPIPSDLTTLYWVVAEVSLPDVDSGYFIHSPDKTAADFREHGPVRIAGEAEDGIVFGSDGGGRPFALAGSGRVWWSASSARFEECEQVASCLEEFLDRLGGRIGSALQGP
ncbi:hypothetical protein [Streptomyces sp. NPDC007369]|uniref:hypothetical protein n=1 Tax=Streptomyces sp. NPDC007369 TaxID=3154589 RepID=UPI0033F5016F